MTAEQPAAGEGTRYAAFLRGINVGGHRTIKMADLAAAFRAMGFTDVLTVIASGNVVFTDEPQDGAAIEAAIEAALARGLGYPVDVMVRPIARLRELVELAPFPAVGADEHAYVSILKRPPAAIPSLPAAFPDEGFAVLGVDGAEIFHITRQLPNGRHGDPTTFLTKGFGKIPTTVRNWNTIVKMAGLERAVSGSLAAARGRGGTG